MPDETVETPPPQTPSPSTAAIPAQTSGISEGIGLCAAALITCFFLPWINFLGLKASGFDLVQKTGGASLLLWAIPVFGAVALVATLTKSNVKTAAQLAAVMPVFALGYSLYDSGTDLFKLLDFGAYIGLFAAVVILVLAPRAK
jgi:hypothetical protein